MSARDPVSGTLPDASDLPRLMFQTGRGEADPAGTFAIRVGSRAVDQPDLR